MAELTEALADTVAAPVEEMDAGEIDSRATPELSVSAVAGDGSVAIAVLLSENVTNRLATGALLASVSKACAVKAPPKEMLVTAVLLPSRTDTTTLGTTVANLGMSDVRFPKPVFHGDTLRARTSVVSVRDSKSRPESGLVEFEHTCLNQRDEVVAVCRRTALMRRGAPN